MEDSNRVEKVRGLGKFFESRPQEKDDTHNTQRKSFYQSDKGERFSKACYLNQCWVIDVVADCFKSRVSAKTEAWKALDKVYNEANRFFAPESKACLADEVAEYYGACLRGRVLPILTALREKAAQKEDAIENIAALERKVDEGEQVLRSQFVDELRNNSSSYKMYRKGYFFEKIKIDTQNYRSGWFLGELFDRELRELFRTEYTVEGLDEAVEELQNDVSSHAELFFSAAYYKYRDYCQQIEVKAKELEKQISVDGLGHKNLIL